MAGHWLRKLSAGKLIAEGVSGLFGALSSLGSSAASLHNTQAEKIRRLISNGTLNFPCEKLLLARGLRQGRVHELQFGKDNNILPKKQKAPQLATLWSLVELVIEVLLIIHETGVPGKKLALLRQWTKTLDICLQAAHQTGESNIVRFFRINQQQAGVAQRPLDEWDTSLWNTAFLGSSPPYFKENGPAAEPQQWRPKDNQQICFPFNRGRCNRRNCFRQHKCVLCGGEHPALRCSNRADQYPAIYPTIMFTSTAIILS